ncbi:MAG: hypothetical protein A2041_11005 [Bacteroidetes bacterium GWA2_31_9b]|nr:MAG: hypothetical protein A2041_11005 [Bacteroidetes bacterium GWA2_31_9b]
MNPIDIKKEILFFCIQNSKEENIKKYSRYFKGGFVGYGLDTGLIEKKVKEIISENKMDIQSAYSVCKLLVKEKEYEIPSFALLMLNEFSKEFNDETFREIGSWFSLGINNWAHTDVLVMYFFPVFWKEEIICLEDLSNWRTAENKFQRRCVPVAMIKYLKHSTDYPKMFAFIDSMMMDPEREVHQGLGWFLRECWKKDRTQTEAFLLKWKNDCARLIIQYATEKLTKEERLQFRKEKV